MSEEEFILVCALADAELAVVGVVYTHSCSRCSRRVMIAPSGQRVLREYPHTVIICTQCFRPEPDAEIELAGSVEEIREEVRSARPNLRRERN